MAQVVSLIDVSLNLGSQDLFENLSFSISEKERLGLLGKNGAGKSSLLKIISGAYSPDSGKVVKPKNSIFSYVAQNSLFDEPFSIKQIVKEYLLQHGISDDLEAEVRALTYLNIVGFEDFECLSNSLSGGWKKRLALCCGIALEPDLLILDEPTNHLDWDGILWLEGWLKSYKKAFIIVSHDRTFLSNVTKRCIEINTLYKDGYLSLNLPYNKFIESKQEVIKEQLRQQDVLANKARREVDWLRAGVKARTTKSSSRIKEAHELLENLSDLKARNFSESKKNKIEIDSSYRKTKKLLEFKDFNLDISDLKLIKSLNLVLGPKTCLGILGGNGSGKTTFLKTIMGERPSDSTQFNLADDLKIIYFDQKKERLPKNETFFEYLGDGNDHVVFRGTSLHVNSYASRFLFSANKSSLPISQLSGGEQARLVVAKLLLQPADVLILDEPTNDLDIDTIEVLETALNSFDGLVLLVSHDRKFLSSLCSQYLSIDGGGAWSIYSDLNQWLKENYSNKDGLKLESQKNDLEKNKKANTSAQKKLSYKDKLRLESIESEIEEAEIALEQAKSDLNSNEDQSNYTLVAELSKIVASADQNVKDLYSIWEDLEKKTK